jgi:uncharacterized protein
MPYDPVPDLAGMSLEEIIALQAARKLPPVGDWAPEKSGDSEMRIAADGRWYHQGGEIKRPAMVRAFASLLRRYGDTYFLVTPTEKLSIIVDDVPFMAVELDHKGKGKDSTVTMRLNTDDIVTVDADHRLEIRGALPYIHVRDGLYAKLTRPVYYELAELALTENPDSPGIWSNEHYFPMESAK